MKDDYKKLIRMDLEEISQDLSEDISALTLRSLMMLIGVVPHR